MPSRSKTDSCEYRIVNSKPSSTQIFWIIRGCTETWNPQICTLWAWSKRDAPTSTQFYFWSIKGCTRTWNPDLYIVSLIHAGCIQTLYPKRYKVNSKCIPPQMDLCAMCLCMHAFNVVVITFLSDQWIDPLYIFCKCKPLCMHRCKWLVHCNRPHLIH